MWDVLGVMMMIIGGGVWCGGGVGEVVKGGVNTKHTPTLRLAHAHTLGRRVGHHGASCIGAEKPD